MSTEEEIAIVGVGCRFPGADNLAEFWGVLVNGENHVKEITRDRWNVDSFYDPDPKAPGKTYVRRAGLLKRFDEWDNKFFGISDAEAELMDPQQRMVLDCVHMAMEEAGLTRPEVSGSKTGVYIGVMNDDYCSQVMGDETVSSSYAVTGTHRSVVSARVSYVYNLCGPALTIDTACSSSLVAMDVGSQALILGNCDMAICGGVNSLLDPAVFIALSHARMLSPTGQCQTYSESADGYARGEGCGIVVLKRLRDAIKDRNKIWGTIRTATNQDGHNATPITAPSSEQQIALLDTIYRKYYLDKTRIDVIEAHGTGTPIGDPVESNALGRFFSKDVNIAKSIYIGSVKTNIGHLEAAAGVAGLIKVLLMMKNKTIVPSLMYNKESENKKLNLNQYDLVVPTNLTPWDINFGKERLACVNSFGFGGTNAHAVVQEYNMKDKRTVKNDSWLPSIVVLSADDPVSLKENIQAFSADLESEQHDLRVISYTSTCKRDHRSHRKAFVVATKDDLKNKCIENAQFDVPDVIQDKNKRIVFVFCGVGTVWNSMCKEMMKVSSFRSTVQEIDKYLKPMLGKSIFEMLSNGFNGTKDPLLSHIAIFACQVSLVSVWKYLGIIPEAVVGQSVGEVAAAYTAGYFDLKTAVKVIYYRSKYLSLVKKGTMVVVKNIKTIAMRQYCKNNRDICVAVVNSPLSCTVSGSRDAIEQLHKDVEFITDGTGVLIDLDVNCAYHSNFVKDAAEKFASDISFMETNSPKVEIFSSVTGQRVENGHFLTRAYWKDNVQMPVLFSDAVSASVSNAKSVIFLEIGPSPVLRAHIGNIFPENKQVMAIPSMRKGGEIMTISEALCRLYESGVNVNWHSFILQSVCISDTPKYKFRRKRNLYLNPETVLRNQGMKQQGSHFSIQRIPKERDDVDNSYRIVIDIKTFPYVYSHIVNKRALLPGAFYTDVGFFIADDILKLPAEDVSLSVEFLKPVYLDEPKQTVLTVCSYSRGDSSIKFLVKNGVSTMCKGFVTIARGAVIVKRVVKITDLEFNMYHKKCNELSSFQFYEVMGRMGFQYGHTFQMAKRALATDTDCLVDIEVPQTVLKDVCQAVVHPCIVDAILQSSACISEINNPDESEPRLIFMPAGIEEIRFFKNVCAKMTVCTRRTNKTILENMIQLQFDCALYASTGELVMYLRNFTTNCRIGASYTPLELLYSISWNPDSREKRITSGQNCEIIILTNISDDQIVEEIKQQEGVEVHKCNSQLDERLISVLRTVTKESPIAILVESTRMFSEIDFYQSNMIYDKIKQYNIFLTNCIRFFKDNEMTNPLFIVTQNAQVLDADRGEICVVSSTLWGFIRSVQMEFVIEHLVLVDVQPSLLSSMKTLIGVLSDEKTYKSVAEILIKENTILYPSFSRLSKMTKVPSAKRFVPLPQEKDLQKMVLHSPCEDKIHSPYFVQVEDFENKSNKSSKYSMQVRLKSVYLHSPYIYRVSRHSDKNTSVWNECKEEGSVVFGIEYTGIIVAETRNALLSCKPSSVHPEEESLKDKWEHVIIFPSELKAQMCVPQDCVVSLKDMPFYRPGMLIYTMFFLEMIKDVPSRSVIDIQTDHQSCHFKWILEELLIQKKRGMMLPGTPNTKVDVLFLLKEFENIDGTLYDSKMIVTFKNIIPISAKRLLHGKIIEIELECLFDKNFLPKNLQKAIRWLGYSKELKHKFQSELSKTQDEKDEYCEDTLQLLRETQQNFHQCLQFSSFLFKKSGTYIVTGGLTGLGWEVVKQISELGAGKVVSFSRKGPNSDKENEMKELQALTKCEIISIQADVSDFESVLSAFKELETNYAPLEVRGIFHGAGVLDSQLLINMTEKSFDTVLKPKISGCLNLHLVSKKYSLDHFLLQSSITSLVGVPGQSNYGAANAFLDAFAIWRRRCGLAGQSVNWGALNLGMAIQNNFASKFEKRGHRLMSVPEIRSCFHQELLRNTTGTVYTSIDWDAVANDYSNKALLKFRHKMEEVIDECITRDPGSDIDSIETQTFDIQKLLEANNETQMAALENLVLRVANRVSGCNATKENLHLELSTLGFDSMSAVTFNNIIYDYTRCTVPQDLLQNPEVTLFKVSEYIHKEVFLELDHMPEEQISHG